MYDMYYKIAFLYYRICYTIAFFDNISIDRSVDRMIDIYISDGQVTRSGRCPLKLRAKLSANSQQENRDISPKATRK